MPYPAGLQLQILEGELGEGPTSEEKGENKKGPMGDFFTGYSGVVRPV